MSRPTASPIWIGPGTPETVGCVLKSITVWSVISPEDVIRSAYDVTADRIKVADIIIRERVFTIDCTPFYFPIKYKKIL